MLEYYSLVYLVHRVPLEAPLAKRPNRNTHTHSHTHTLKACGWSLSGLPSGTGGSWIKRLAVPVRFPAVCKVDSGLCEGPAPLKESPISILQALAGSFA